MPGEGSSSLKADFPASDYAECGNERPPWRFASRSSFQSGERHHEQHHLAHRSYRRHSCNPVLPWTRLDHFLAQSTRSPLKNVQYQRQEPPSRGDMAPVFLPVSGPCRLVLPPPRRSLQQDKNDGGDIQGGQRADQGRNHRNAEPLNLTLTIGSLDARFELRPLEGHCSFPPCSASNSVGTMNRKPMTRGVPPHVG